MAKLKRDDEVVVIAGKDKGNAAPCVASLTVTASLSAA